MKKTFYLQAAVLLFLAAAYQCEKKEEVNPDTIVCVANASLEGTWRLQAYQDLATGTLNPDPDPKGRGVVFTFTEEGKSGKIAGHTVANTIFGSYVKGSSCDLEQVTFGGTKVGEPTSWSSKAWTAMNGAESFKQGGDRLYIDFNKRSERMIFERQR